MTDEEAELWAWSVFAQTYPHEAYAAWPERFWQFFQTQRPGISREEMEQLLKETE